MRRVQVDFSKRIRDWDGSYQVNPGYYYYKQVCRAGQPGMAVARVLSNDSEVGLIAFASNGTASPNAFVVLNLVDGDDKDLKIQVVGSESQVFEAYRTSEGEQYTPLGEFEVRGGAIAYDAPPKSVTTFYAR